MLAEHLITKPVFDALFDNYSFLQSNPVSRIMQNMLDVLHDNALEKEQETLDKFYASVQERAKGIDNAEGKQKIIIELYEQFFKNALPKETERLGIVYTPVEVVDFIIQSVEYVMQQRFGRSISDKGVHVLDRSPEQEPLLSVCFAVGLSSRRMRYTNTQVRFTVMRLFYWPTILPLSILRKPIMN